MKKNKKILTCFFFLIYILRNQAVEAGIFLKAKNPIIIQDNVWLHSNSTSITSTVTDLKPKRFSKRVISLENVYMPPKTGIAGILYNREESCSSNTVRQPIPLPFFVADPKYTNVPKIALIKKQGGNCTVYEKILNAQLEGAIGVILYSEIDYNNETQLNDRNKGVPALNNIKISAYFVDQMIGLELYHGLKQMASLPVTKIRENDNHSLTARISVRIQLLPVNHIKPSAWEVALLVLIIVLGTILLFSGKKNRRLNN